MKFLQNTFEKIVKWSVASTEDKAKLQNITGAVAWGVSCLAYVGAIALNKNIPSDQKKFLIPQELTDGAINVGLFLAITSKAQKIATKQLEKGNIWPKDMKEEVSSIKKQIGENAKLGEVEKHLKPESVERLGKFKTTYPLLISIIGSAIASNIVTPIVRNIVASKIQDKTTEDADEIARKFQTSPIYKKPVPQPFNVVRNSSFGSGQMRI
jgi:hypothetical protein